MPTPWLVLIRRIGNTWRVTPIEVNSAAIGEVAGSATWTAHPALPSWRASRRSAWSEPPRSATGCTDRTVRRGIIGTTVVRQRTTVVRRDDGSSTEEPPCESHSM